MERKEASSGSRPVSPDCSSLLFTCVKRKKKSRPLEEALSGVQRGTTGGRVAPGELRSVPSVVAPR